MVVKFLLLFLAAYLLGSVPSAYLVARWSRGIDIRQHGSGNVGASNILAVVSKRWTVPVVAFDLFKGMVAVWVAQWLGLSMALQVAVGLAAVMGHNWSVFLRFSGGRGMLTSLGVLFALSPKLGLIALVLSFLFAPFHQLSFGVSLALLSLPILSWFLAQPLDITERQPMTLGSLAILLIALLRRLAAPHTSVTASVSAGELFINRLFFDRDIRDREAWIRRAPLETSPKPQFQEPEKNKGQH